MNRVSVLPSILCLAGLLPAQGSITAGNVTYTVGFISSGQTESVNSAMTANQAGAPNVLFEHWYYYRIGSDPNEIPFRDFNLSQSYAGGHADLDWSDVDNRRLIAANLDLDVVSTGATSGVVVARMTITNIDGAPLELNLFQYADVDVCGFSNNTASGTGDRHVVANPSCNEAVEFFGWDIDRFDVGQFSSQELGLFDGVAGDLAGNPPPLTGDYTGAFQWEDRVLQPGESVTFTTCLSHNDSCCPAAVDFYGSALAGSTGVPQIDASGLPIANTTPAIELRAARPNAIAAVLVSPLPGNTQILGLTICLDLATSFDIGVVVDPQGEVSLPATVPGDPGLCGALVHYQWVVADPGAANGFASHTRCMRWRLGPH